MLDALAPYAKAVVAFLAPGILVLCVPLLAGRMPSAADWLMALGTALTTALAVYAIPNAPLPTGTRYSDPDAA